MRVAVGIDVAEARKGLDLVALDQERRVVASEGHLTPEDVVSLVLESIRPVVVCIDSPSGWSRTGQSRMSERALAQLGISAFATGQDRGDHPFYRWMQVGFRLFEALEPSYPLFRGQEPTMTAAEAFPHATAVLLAGPSRDRAESKNAFRRRVLGSCGVEQSELPNLDRVDAALAALTGLLALEGSWTGLGDPDEGMILLPVAQLPVARLRPAPVSLRARVPRGELRS